jgi:hypothetical protein
MAQQPILKELPDLENDIHRPEFSNFMVNIILSINKLDH